MADESELEESETQAPDQGRFHPRSLHAGCLTDVAVVLLGMCIVLATALGIATIYAISSSERPGETSSPR